ncbi:MAG: hypothetical protein GWN61_25010, partial [candidate division Zixibacteria bacterium]|nr:VCBS repeat-containing protein [candidate division Zixibacteria bacterium]NIS49127.1 VCBS repeat-containing protein [candidate division Zixibacteria bacterium]NIU17222.1 VCBS repeat-containing protein [candidate division Zixibacteria bacterium]NIV09342.1 hypothetical protein [candidate division Zixibacteria bacterium]
MRHVVDGNYTGSRDVVAIDLDRDGDLDLISCADGNENKVVWWQNDGQQIFTRQLIDDNFPGAKNIDVADLDRDGDLDIVGTAVGTGEVILFENDSN